MTTLVTGAAGFLGRAVVDQLTSRGEEVVAVDRQPPGSAGDALGVAWRQGDVSEAGWLAEVLAEAGARQVVHLAYVLPPESETRPERAVLTNCAGSAAVFEASRRAGVERVIWTSSMSVYGPAGRYPAATVDEKAEPHPVSLYGATKVLVERLAEAYRDLGLSVVGLRFNLVFGPGRVRGLGPFVAWGRDMVEACALGRPFRVPAADHEADWLYVKDAAGAISCALRARAPAGVYNVLGERAAPRWVASLLAGMTPSWRCELEPGDLGEGLRVPVFDGTAAERELGFRPSFSLEAALSDYLDQVRRSLAAGIDRSA
jgi:nucleoside-diphosphate-sugar epimerase